MTSSATYPTPSTGLTPLFVSRGESSKDAPRRGVVFDLPGLVIQHVDDKLIATLTGKVISGAVKRSYRRQLIDRLFSIRSLQSARIRWRKVEVRLEFDSVTTTPESLVTALANAMSARRPSAFTLPHDAIILGEDAPSSFSVHRADSELTLWHVQAPSAHFFRITHPLLRSEFVRARVLEELGTLSDVIIRSFYIPIAGKEALLVFGRPHRIDPALFREVLDPVLDRCLQEEFKPRELPFRDRLVNVNLATAALTDVLVPPLGIANIVLTSMLSANYIPRALHAWRQGKVSVELLYLIIACFTIITYEFLPAALMYWLLSYWPRRTRNLYELHYSKHLSRYRLRPRRVWVDRSGTALETRVEDLVPDSVVTLSSGDIVPGDGLVLEGAAQLDERVLTGLADPVYKEKGSVIYAASRILEGSIRIQIRSLGEATAVGRLARWYDKSDLRTLVPTSGHASAEKAVLPVLVITALAAVQGGLNTAKAVIRPDYATGPAVAENLGFLAAVIRAANLGILISSTNRLNKLVGPVTLVFDDSIDWKLPGNSTGTFTHLAQAQGVGETVFFSTQSTEATSKLAAELGFSRYYGETPSETKREYMAQRQKIGRTVIYVGNCRQESRVAAQADLAITVAVPPFELLDKSFCTLLSPQLLKVLDLRAIALDLEEEGKTAFKISMTPNVAAILAAFLFPNPIYLSILLTNLGTFSNLVRSETILQLTANARSRG